MIQPWMTIAAVTFLVALGGFLIRPRDLRWGKRLDRPNWLFFEPAIPLIWTLTFICGATSALIVWQQNPGTAKNWLLMAIYLLVEVVTVAYIPATLRSRSLTVGTVLGAIGFLCGLGLALTVWSSSYTAALLLLPYLIWSPVGTYTTRQMIDLNPDAA
jgi:tryptophan-rich sensory protein